MAPKENPSSNKTGTPQESTAPTISLPKGGGAIRGIGEKFAANPVTGTGSMSVPIATSPGPLGFRPAALPVLRLGRRQRPVRLRLEPLPSCRSPARPTRALPQYLDAGGFGRLHPLRRRRPGARVPAGLDGTWVAGHRVPADATVWVRDPWPLVVHEDELDGYRVRRYRPRIEGLFARIERWSKLGAPGDVHWRSISKDNILTLYGVRCELADRRSARCKPHLQLADLRDARRQGQRRPLPLQGGGRAWCRSRQGARAQPRAAERRPPHGQPLPQAHPLRQPHAAARQRRAAPAFPGQAQIDTQIDNADWMFEVVFDYGEHDADAPKPNDDGGRMEPVPARTRSPPIAPASRSAPRASASAC